MSSTVYVKQKRRGLHLTHLYLTISGSMHKEAVTDCINVHHLALVCFTFKLVKGGIVNQYDGEIKVKKNPKVKFSAVKIWFSSDEFEGQCICDDDAWIIRKMKPKSIDHTIPNQQNGYSSPVYTTSIVVDIAVHEIKPISLQANKLYEDTALTDFHLCATDGDVAVHKAILAMHSEVFMTMLSGEWKETKQNLLTIDGATLQTLENLKQYMYLGTLPKNDLEPLLLVAARYMMDKLKADCIDKLVDMVTPENLDDLVEFACANNVPDLMRAILFETPDSIVNGLVDLKIKGPKD